MTNINNIIAIDDAEITEADLDRIANHADKTDDVDLMEATWHRSFGEHFSRGFRMRLKRRFLALQGRLRDDRLKEEHDRFIRPVLEAPNLVTLCDLLNRDMQRACEDEWFTPAFARAFLPRGHKAPIHRLPVFSRTRRELVVPAGILDTATRDVGGFTVVSHDDANAIVLRDDDTFVIIPRDIEAEVFGAVCAFIDAEYPNRTVDFEESDLDVFDSDDGDGEVSFDLKLRFRRRAWRETYVDDAPTGDGDWITLSDEATLSATYNGEWAVHYYDPGVIYREDFSRGCYVRC